MRPTREPARNNRQTYMVTSATWQRRALFRNDNWAKLFVQNLFDYRGKGFLLHEFVLMPDHFHIIVSPTLPLERTVQLIKGGFSYRAKKELGSNMEIWQRGFSDHRLRDIEDYRKHVTYIQENPVRARLVIRPEHYLFSSAHPGYKMASAPEKFERDPQGLKPAAIQCGNGAAEAAPFQRLRGDE